MKKKCILRNIFEQMSVAFASFYESENLQLLNFLKGIKYVLDT